MALSIIKFFLLLAIFTGLVLFVQSLMGMVMSQRLARHAINRRLGLLQQGLSRQTVAALLRADHFVTRHSSSSLLGRLYRMMGRAKLGVTPQQLMFGMGVATAAVFIVLLFLCKTMSVAFTGGVLLLLLSVTAALGVGLPLMVIAQRAQRRSKEMEAQFPNAIDIFTRALRAGHPVPSAITLLTEEMKDPIGTEFGLVSDEIAYGAETHQSLRNMADRWDLPDLNMFVVCLSVQSETGGNLAEILTNLSTVIRDRANLFLKVRALSSEGRGSAWMLSLLPVITVVVLFLTNPAFYLDVAQDPLFFTCYAALLVLYVIGVLWLRNLVNLKV